MSELEAIIFDFDDTIINTSHLKHFRDSNDFGAIEDHDLAKTSPYRPIVHTLRKLREMKIKVAIVTNSPATYVHRLLDYHDMSQFIDVTVTYNDVLFAGKKPSPKGIELALKKLGVDAAAAAYVGDEYTDVVAAYRANVMPIVPSWGSRAPVSTPPAAELSSSGLIGLVSDVEQKLLFGERCAINGSTEFEREDARFLPLDDDSNVVTIRNKMATFCLGRYFSQKGRTTALIHDKHPLSLEIARKDHIQDYQLPEWVADMLLKIAKAAGQFLFEDGGSIDLVTIVPHKPAKAPRLEHVLDRMQNLARVARLPIEFRSDILFFDYEASASLRGMSSNERMIEQQTHLHSNRVDLRGRNVLIIDDVITSGATIGRAISLLRDLGSRSVHGVGIAKTVSITEDTKSCPQCQRDMIIQKNRGTGERFWSCSGYFDDGACRYSESLVVQLCPKCNKPLYLMKNKKNGTIFYGCSGFRDSPSCTFTRTAV